MGGGGKVAQRRGWATRFVGGVTFVDGLLLTATGTWLLVGYRPTVAAGRPLGANVVYATDWVRFAHRWSARVLIAVTLAWLGVAIARILTRRTGVVGVVAAVSSVVLGIAATFTGWLLPWDQLALWSVTVGDNVMGYRMLFDDRLRFLLLGGTEVNPSSLRIDLLIHAVAIPIAFVVLALIGRRVASGESHQLSEP